MGSDDLPARGPREPAEPLGLLGGPGGSFVHDAKPVRDFLRVRDALFAEAHTAQHRRTELGGARDFAAYPWCDVSATG